MKTVDARVRDILAVKFKLGLSDQPYVKDAKRADQIVHTPAEDEMELELNKQSFMLLKNSYNLVPLNKSKLAKFL